jgi:hypothetical protein
MASIVISEIVPGRAPALRRLTTSEFHQMLALGILPEGEPIADEATKASPRRA